jgi:wyosine [tRNA(Phe)-imidazoG37] synthetase (radical SAM superfamily)
MNAKVDELFHLIESLKHRHDEQAIVKYADSPMLTEDIQKVDAIYLCLYGSKKKSLRSVDRGRLAASCTTP